MSDKQDPLSRILSRPVIAGLDDWPSAGASKPDPAAACPHNWDNVCLDRDDNAAMAWCSWCGSMCRHGGPWYAPVGKDALSRKEGQT